MRLVQSQAENASQGQDHIQWQVSGEWGRTEVNLRSQYVEQGPYLHCALPGIGRAGAGDTSIQQLRRGLKFSGLSLEQAPRQVEWEESLGESGWLRLWPWTCIAAFCVRKAEFQSVWSTIRGRRKVQSNLWGLHSCYWLHSGVDERHRLTTSGNSKSSADWPGLHVVNW